MVCISCKNEHSSDFCPNYGEKSNTRKITFTSIFEDTFSTITAMDRGVLYNVKNLFLRPQEFTSEYILGKRRGVLNPISFLIISTTVYLIIESILRIPIANPELKLIPESDLQKVGFAAGKTLANHFKYFWILSIIPLSISTKLIFRKYNFTEHLAINSFILGQATLIGLISYLIAKTELPVNPLVYLTILGLVYRVFLKQKEKYETILMSFGVLLLFIFQLFVIVIGIGMITA
jgi:hypothetical protein